MPQMAQPRAPGSAIAQAAASLSIRVPLSWTVQQPAPCTPVRRTSASHAWRSLTMRHRVERTVERLKNSRAVAPRYEERAEMLRGTVTAATIVIQVFGALLRPAALLLSRP